MKKLIKWIKCKFYKVSNPSLVTPPVSTPSFPDSKDQYGLKLLYYPKAVKVKGMITRGNYKHGYPIGAVVHYTAGWDLHESKALESMSKGAQRGFAYFLIGPEGKVYQSAPLNRWGYHAGISKWPSIGESVSKQLVGIEVACAGKLDEYGRSWFGHQYAPEEIREVDEATWECPSGKYKKYTVAQERALDDLLYWLKDNNPGVFKFENVLGHHEVSGKKGLGVWRKTDPGGSIGMPMKDYRKYLAMTYGVPQNPNI